MTILSQTLPHARKSYPCDACAAFCRSGLGDDDRPRLVKGSEGRPPARHGQAAESDFCAGGVADSTSERRERGQDSIGPAAKDPAKRGEGLPDAERCGEYDRPGPTNGHWRSADWLLCRDGKWRPVEPKFIWMVNGASARVVRLRGYGNSINAVQAQAFVEAFMEAHSTRTPQKRHKIRARN